MVASNITSIPGHIEELRIYMNLKCTDILAVNETGLDDTISSGEVSVPGYALERNDRNRDEGVSRFTSGILSIMNDYLISSGKLRVDWH